MAQLFGKKEIFIQAPPESVWLIQTDINGWGGWQRGIASSNLSGPLVVGGVFNWKTGGLAITSTLDVVETNRRISWRGRAIGTQAHHAWTFTAKDGGTTVTTEESMSGWLVGLLKLMSPQFLDKALEVWLGALKARAEATGRGEPRGVA